MASKKISDRFMTRRKSGIGSMTESERIAARRYHCHEAAKYKNQRCVDRGSRGGLAAAKKRTEVELHRDELMNEVDELTNEVEVLPSLKGKILCLENENRILTEENTNLLEYMRELRIENTRLRNITNTTDIPDADTCECYGSCSMCHPENFTDTDTDTNTDEGRDVIDGETKI